MLSIILRRRITARAPIVIFTERLRLLLCSSTMQHRLPATEATAPVLSPTIHHRAAAKAGTSVTPPHHPNVWNENTRDSTTFPTEKHGTVRPTKRRPSWRMRAAAMADGTTTIIPPRLVLLRCRRMAEDHRRTNYRSTNHRGGGATTSSTNGRFRLPPWCFVLLLLGIRSSCSR